MLRRSPIIYAHRGASFELPENTLGAFRLAIELGADAIETDAHMTRDGRIVLSHDPTGERMAGVARAIRESTLAEVRGWDVSARFVARGVDGRHGSLAAFRMPTLEEALEELPDVAFNVDAKQEAPEMVPALVRCVRALGATDRVRIASFSTKNLKRARALGYEGSTGLSPGEVARAMLAPRWAGRFANVDGDAAQVPLKAWGVTFAKASAIDRLHALGLRVDFWTVDEPALAKKLFALGADGVMTDDPRTLCGDAGAT